MQDGDSHNNDDDDVESDLDANEETVLEIYVTPLDSSENNQEEYVIFKEVMQSKKQFSVR